MSTTSPEQNNQFNETITSFGDRLAAAREAKGLLVDGLAQKIGIDAQTVETWEDDTDAPRANHIQMLAGLLNVSIVWLISGEGNGTSNVADTFNRPDGINDALGEISELKASMTRAYDKLKRLENRLLEIK